MSAISGSAFPFFFKFLVLDLGSDWSYSIRSCPQDSAETSVSFSVSDTVSVFTFRTPCGQLRPLRPLREATAHNKIAMYFDRERLGEVLARSWRGLGEVLARSWRGRPRYFAKRLRTVLRQFRCCPSRQLRFSSDSRTLRIPHIKTKTFGHRSFSRAAPSVWNSLPHEIRHNLVNHCI